MSQTWKPSELKKAVMEQLENYVEDIEDDVVKVTNELTKEAVKELKETSPKRKGTRENPYHKGWRRSGLRSKITNRYTIRIYNKTNYQLTHLLEFGHATRNGGRTKAIPHIRPMEEKYKKLYERDLITAIRRRKRNI